MKFDGYLLVTDMDNTLLNSDHVVSEGNKQAVKYFTENGGKFTIATGRSAAAARDKIEGSNVDSGLAINAPAILLNGAVLYDFDTDTVLSERHISDGRKAAARIMHEKYPFLGFEIYTGDDVYVYSKCHLTDRLGKRKGIRIFEMTDEAWTLPWTKLLMISDKKTLDEYEDIYRQYDSGYSVRSGDEFFDIVPDGASKGCALNTLSQMLGIEKKRVIAAGDNFNDLDLLKAAGISYAVANAQEDVKQAAGFGAPSCDDDAIAWIIGEIERLGEGNV